ncbi:hypothetical protein ACJ2A9_09625 [Anaerobacillus sp. MEB173]|uniref:hypothetical protein n=1 Tax=Anaerobacillus sp. MEB173 TaxID=3383345 RepID=UPI003F8DFBB0
MRFAFTVLILTIIIVGCEKEATNTLELSRAFESNGYEFKGVEGKIGIQNTTLKAQEYQKVLWHFWGDSEEIKGNFRVEGTHLVTGEKKPILLVNPQGNETTWEYDNHYTQPNLGADKTKPSALWFDKSGIWKLDVILDNSHFAEIIVEVK